MTMRLQDFMFANRFRDFNDPELQEAVSYVNAMFPGVASLWSAEYCPLTDEERNAKRFTCYNFLVAWYIVQNYPSRVVGGVSGGAMGGMPLESKSIEDVSIKYKNVIRQGGALALLTTNTFGIQALEMLQSAPENFVLF